MATSIINSNSDGFSIAIIVALIALVSAVFSAITNKVFDIYQSSKQHKQKLEQEYFLRKINAFEKSVAFLQSSQATVRTIVQILQSIIEFETYHEGQTFTDQLNSVNDLHKSITEKTSEAYYSTFLYIETNSHAILTEKLNQFNSMLGKIGFVVNEYNIGKQKDFHEFEAELHDRINKLGDLSAELTDSCNVSIKELRNAVLITE